MPTVKVPKGMRPIEEARKDNVPVLLYARSDVYPATMWGVGVWVPKEYSGRKSAWEWPYDVPPTHWCDLPE